MSNTFTDLYPHIYTALNVVSRERIGFIPAVANDSKSDQVAVGQQVIASVVPAMTAGNTSPSAYPQVGQDRNVDNVQVEITKSRQVSFNLTGEQQAGLGQFNNMTIEAQTFAQAFRTLSNEIESDLAGEYVNASRANGTAGTTPFATQDDLTNLTQTMAILDENGAPKSDRHIILNSNAGATLLGKQPAMFKVNQAGTELSRQQAQFQEMFGAQIGISAQVNTHSGGNGSGYQLNGAVSKGDTSIVVDTGTGSINAGDVITLAGGTDQYVVTSGVSAPGTITIGKPGAVQDYASTAAVDIVGNYSANMAFSRDAVLLATRTPYITSRGDAAQDRTYVTDPTSGLTFEVSYYPQYREGTFFVGIAWGYKTIKQQHQALLLG